MIAGTALASVALAVGIGPGEVVPDLQVEAFDWCDVPGMLAKVKRYVVEAPFPGGDVPCTPNAGPVRNGLGLLVTSKLVSYRHVAGGHHEDITGEADALAHKQLAAALRGDWANAGPNTLWIGEYDQLPQGIEDIEFRTISMMQEAALGKIGS